MSTTRTASMRGLGRFNAEQARRLAALDATPELPLRRDDEVLIERVGMSSLISTHFPPPVMTDNTVDSLPRGTHILCWSCGHIFSAAASSENDHGSMNLASNTAPVASIPPSRVAAIHERRVLSRRWTPVSLGRYCLRTSLG